LTPTEPHGIDIALEIQKQNPAIYSGIRIGSLFQRSNARLKRTVYIFPFAREGHE
jgi:hypothetical protein